MPTYRKLQRENPVNKSIRTHGVTLLLSGHPTVRRLKRFHQTSLHGNKLWSSSWVLMDFLAWQKIPPGLRIMDVGCGWGLLGIFCAKRLGAAVTSVDSDPEVFPFLDLHAEINKVKITTMNRGLGGLTVEDLRSFDVLVAADICFWDNLAPVLKRLINRALKADVRMVLIADPGRQPFYDLGEYFSKTKGSETLEWTVKIPRKMEGRILKIGSFS
jgi:predicted nicotinamide N-methyase